MIKRILLNLNAPFVDSVYRKFFLNNYGYHGNFKTWEEASGKSAGYTSQEIVEKVKKTALLAKDKKIAFERDSIAFFEKDYSWPLLTILLTIYQRKPKKLNIIDFGGSLGSSYYQHIDFLRKMFSEIRWNIVEQPKFASIGIESFSSKELQFYDDLDLCVRKSKAKVLLVSSCIGYIENPFALIKKIKRYGFTDIIFDRTVFVKEGNHRITIQRTLPEIYNTTYPCWIFNLNRFQKLFKPEYNILSVFPNYSNDEGKVDGEDYKSMGIWFKIAK